MPQRNNNITIISSEAPYASLAPIEAINAGFAAAAFDHEVTFLFINDGVFQLCNDQDAAILNQKTIGKVLGAASLYGIEKIYACKHSLEERGLDKENLILSPALLGAEEIHQVISDGSTLLSF